MLEDAAGIRRVVIACGYVDLRKGIDGLSMIIGDRYHQNPFEKGTLFLFCGRRSDRIKGLLWMGDGFLQLYKRLEAGSLSWPRTSEEAADLTEEQFRYLMMGLNPLNPKVREVTPQSPPDLCANIDFYACYPVRSIPGVTASLNAVSWSVTYPQEDPDKISAP